jgi:putative peptidoglycan lipid II flippase|tara:strand:+ start:3242 stop:4771 length:1530 start_codon:yes stop_codon:yes gene_type:complete
MNIIKSTSTFSFYTLISRLLGYLRDILIAIFLGSGPLADAFFVAFRIPNTFRRLFAEGTFNAAFVPSYSSQLSIGKKSADKFATSIFSILTIILLFLVLVIEMIMPFFVFLIAPGFDSDLEKMNLAITLTRLTFPFLIFVSLSSFFSGILNSHNKFAAASAAPIILNILLISILIFSNYLGDKLVFYLSLGVSLAGLLQLFFLYFFVKKYFLPKISFKFKINKKIKIFFKKLLPSIFSSGVTQINILVGTIIASFEASAVSYLYYADRIYQINLAIAGIAIGTVILPQLSKHLQNNKFKKVEMIQNKSLELSLFLSLPASVAILIASNEIISSLFGYGSFDNESVSNSAKALFYFALGLPAFSLIKVFSSFMFARHDTKTPFYLSLISVIINIIISLSFFNTIGFIIIPIATSIASWFNAAALYLFLSYNGYYNFRNSVFFNILKIFISTILMGLFFKFLIQNFKLYLEYGFQYKIVSLLIIVSLTLIFYVTVSILIKAFKISDIKLKY